MDKKKQVSDSEARTLQTLRSVIGDDPHTDPEKWNKYNQLMQKSDREIESTVKRIIALLEQD
ncbi:MAG: hypothetical protein ABSA23_07570 [Anaerolineales bacterium]|jgi:hypothetical protein